MGVDSGGQGAVPPWIYKHGTNIVDRCLKVLFSAFFCYFLVFFPLDPPWKIFCRLTWAYSQKNTGGTTFLFVEASVKEKSAQKLDKASHVLLLFCR